LLLEVRVLPPRVGFFYARAHRVARRAGDRFSIDSAARPRELADLIRLAHRRVHVVELGTGTAWTAIALALSDARRRVTTYDPVVRAQRELYLSLVGPDVRERIDFVTSPGGAAAPAAPWAELVFIDSSHSHADTIAEFEAWRLLLRDGAVVAFHDYAHPLYPGVATAIEELRLEGEVRGGMFVWTAK